MSARRERVPLTGRSNQSAGVAPTSSDHKGSSRASTKQPFAMNALPGASPRPEQDSARESARQRAASEVSETVLS